MNTPRDAPFFLLGLAFGYARVATNSAINPGRGTTINRGPKAENRRQFYIPVKGRQGAITKGAGKKGGRRFEKKLWGDL